MNKFIAILEDEPAMITAFLNGAAVMIAAFVSGVSQTQEAAIVTIGGILVTVLTAAFTRPVKLATIAGAITTGLTVAAAFGLHLKPDQLGTVSTLLMLLSAIAVRLAPDVFALARGHQRPPGGGAVA